MQRIVGIARSAAHGAPGLGAYFQAAFPLGETAII